MGGSVRVPGQEGVEGPRGFADLHIQGTDAQEAGRVFYCFKEY